MTTVIDNPIRRMMQPPSKLAEIMRPEPNMIVLEVGPGKGTYTLEVAKRVHHGKVVAIDIQESIVNRLKKKCEDAGIKKVEAKVMNVYTLSFEDEAFDRIFLVCCLPEIPGPCSGTSGAKPCT